MSDSFKLVSGKKSIDFKLNFILNKPKSLLMFLSQDYLDPSKLKGPLGNKKVLHDPTAERRKSHVFNETLLDKELSHWSECKINGKKIQRRSYHSCVCYDKKY